MRGVIEGDALPMLEGVLAVSDIQVRDIMVPRAQMTVLNRDDESDLLLKTVVESGHSRFPVMDEDREKIVGILLAKDLLRLAAQDPRGADGATSTSRNSCGRRCSCRNRSASTCCCASSGARACTWPSSPTNTAASPAW